MGCLVLASGTVTVRSSQEKVVIMGFVAGSLSCASTSTSTPWFGGEEEEMAEDDIARGQICCKLFSPAISIGDVGEENRYRMAES